MTAPERVDVSVLVPVRDEERHIEAAVAGMRAQDFKGTAEFLLLDGGSKDSTLRKVAQLTGGDPRFHVIVKQGWSIPERLNFGLRSARGQIVARMDAHAVFPPSYLTDGIRRLAVGDVSSVSGPQIASGDGFWSRRIALALRSPLGRGGARFRQLTATEIDVDSGYCGVWRRALLLAHDGWDERALRGEDMELAFRVRRAGGRIVCVPSMAARYSPRETLGRLALQYWRYAERRAWAASLHPQILRRSQLLPPALALTVLSAPLAPPRMARAARAAMKLYSAGLLAESIRLSKDESPSDAIALPAVFLTMHLAWGFGFLFGCLLHAPPTAKRRAPRGPS
ncbi:MAG: succinoglycan biosynthesis protein ExoA [Solirubrobacteraceae bacterium]|jgi:succinoglycan biosynthesis protein ExoA|nr:succinoglycan biosynthesis protein ExoA [Solirubrobacteraceae bacterium]